jgi:(p)ppGpp synthase/HD superfamily hydrolase
MDIAAVLNTLSAKILGLDVHYVGGDRSAGIVTLEVKDLTELKTIMGRLQSVSGVSEVTRS